jgi:putative ABC transport system permease protein
VFGAAAVILAMIGVYGVTAYAVIRRNREIGIRIALGAQPSAVLALALHQSIAMTVTGIVLGLTGAIPLARYLQGMLFGLEPLDPITFLAVPLLFIGTAMLAAFLPARRATKVDPIIALRCE